MSWNLSDWPNERINDHRDWLTELMGMEWHWDPAATSPRFRAFQGMWTLGVSVDGGWFLDKLGISVASAWGADSFESGARELFAVFQERTR